MRMIKIYRTPLFEDDERELHPGRGDENENIFHQYLNETGIGRNTMLPWWYRDNKIKRTGKEPSDDEVMMDNMASSSFVDTPFNEETGFSKMSCECGHCVGMDAVWKKLCPAGKAAAKKKFDVYPSAYANGWAVQYCRGKFKGKKKK
tara:strand:- start:931 stop:1371 length:441 start_codon:yes stop_codon:yes gene_type:complete